jgi:Flp pilus assembly protein TadD
MLDILLYPCHSYDEAIRLNPQYAQAWYNKGAALEAFGRDAEASTAFAMAMGQEMRSDL